jgi:hypothetical protein
MHATFLIELVFNGQEASGDRRQWLSLTKSNCRRLPKSLHWDSAHATLSEVVVVHKVLTHNEIGSIFPFGKELDGPVFPDFVVVDAFQDRGWLDKLTL